MSEATTPRLKKPSPLDRLRAKKPMEKSVDVLLEPSLAETYEAKQRALNTAKIGDDQKAIKAAQAEFDAIKSEVEENTVTMRFRSVGRKVYDDIVKLHPPTEEQKAEAKEQGGDIGFNPDTFPIALIAASCVDPEMTEDEASELLEDWNSSEVITLYTTALEVNTSHRIGELGKGFGQTNAFGRS